MMTIIHRSKERCWILPIVTIAVSSDRRPASQRFPTAIGSLALPGSLCSDSGGLAVAGSIALCSDGGREDFPS